MLTASEKSKVLALASLVFFVLLSTVPYESNAYKLNVPKVLLPYHSSKLITFTLEAKTDSSESTDDPCFVWSSSRPDIVSITPIYQTRERTDSDGSPNECSSKAIVSAVSKHAQRYTSIILAKETKTDKLIRCDVIVDKINSIRIKHTTTHLYLEDSPESFTVEALDDEGNTFSSIDGLPFEYNIINDLDSETQNLTSAQDKLDSRNILRLSKFIESEYAVSDSIRSLERIGLSGHQILIEGLKTGMANVQAKLIDSNYKETMKTPLVRLLVVANILLEPSYTVYLLQGSTVKYNVFLIKQTSIEKISLPSLQYYFESRNTTAADLLSSDPTSSTIIGKDIGSTEIVLTDRNMKEDIYTILPPPTALVHVVQPDHLIFTIKNWRSSWILEVGRAYEIMVHVYSEKKELIFPSDNLNIETVFQAANFRLDYQSKNGSYHIVTGLQKGSTQAKASLIGTFNTHDNIDRFEYVARGEQDIELLDPIVLTPKLIIFARQVFLPTDFYSTGIQKNSYELKLQATGGSNSYYWQTRNSTIANVNSNGVLRSTATQVGHTAVMVTDTRNIDIQSQASVFVLDPIDLQIHPCPVETQVGTKLYLNIRMNALMASDTDETPQVLPISDCSRLQFEVSIQDESVYRLVAVQSPFGKSGHAKENSCAVLVLDALTVGRTSIKISTIASGQDESQQSINDDHSRASSLIQLNSNDLQIGSYSPLKSYKKQLVLNEGSSLMVHLFDGPLFSSLINVNLNTNSIDSIQSSMYATQTTVSDEDLLEIVPVAADFEPNKYSYLVKCLKYSEESSEAAFSSARFSVWHKGSPHANSCPVEFEYEIKILCARPYSLHLNQLLVNNDESTSELAQAFDQLNWKCPIKLSANQIMAHFNRPLFVQVQVRDSFNNLFDNFTSDSTYIQWKTDSNMLGLKSHSALDSMELSVDESLHGVQLMNKETLNSRRVYYQAFSTKSVKGDTKLSARLQNPARKGTHDNQLSTVLSVHFVSDVKVTPETLTVFNHPSNVVSLSLLAGSGYYHAEVETIKSLNSEGIEQGGSESAGNVLKINHISANSVVVSPMLNNGLTLLNVFDYCVAPEILQQKIVTLKEGDSSINRQIVQWAPSTTSRIQVAGINSIVANYEDDKLEVKKQLRIYVQISDGTGNLIKTNYFSLMNLNAKLTVSSEIGVTSDSMGSIVPASLEEYENSTIKEEDREFTAVFILNAHKTGIINVQFEAKSDGYMLETGLNVVGNEAQTIRSHLKEVQIYAPLNVQPKYIELAEGAFYQITTNGGPMLTDAAIHYVIVRNEYEESDSMGKKVSKNIVQVSRNGIVNALCIGTVRVVARSIGTNKKQRVYSEDHFVVKVVKLHSVHLQVPLRSIKVGNEMPVFVMANERKLTPLNFASSENLRYLWKINDKQIGSLHHPMLDQNSGSSKQTDDYSIFDSSFALRFKASKPGTVKVTVRVEITDKKSGQLTSLTDSIEISVFELAYFNHLSPAYFHFKYPELKQITSKDAINTQTILITPGSQFQVKTNLDKSAFKLNIHYQLSFFNQAQSEEGLFTSGAFKYCNNNTIQINQYGLITTSPVDHYKLKNAKQCIATLLVSIYVNDQQADTSVATPAKQQTLVYTIKMKPVVYTMLRLRRITKSAKNELNRVSSLNNVQMQWHVSHYDDLGDMFDVVNTNTKYSISRNDLVDFNKMNKNLFVYSANIVGIGSDQEQSQLEEAAKRVKQFESAYSSMSLVSNANENAFVVRTVKPGRFIMELTPSSAFNQIESKDFLSIHIEDVSIEGIESLLVDNRHLEAKVGDIVCLENEDYLTLDLGLPDEDVIAKEADSADWKTKPENIVQLVSNPERSSILGMCVNQGKTVLNKPDYSSIEILVKQVKQMNFLPSSVKYVTNTPNKNLNKQDNQQSNKQQQLSPTSNLVQFQSAGSFYSQNCSSSFEKAFYAQNINEALIPFKCSASLYTESGKRELSYLNQLIKTKLTFFNRHWTCDVQFVPDSSVLMYDLIDSNQEQTADSQQNKRNYVDNEPVLVRVAVEAKEETIVPSAFVYELPFIPAFHVHTRQIQLPISRNSFYLQNLKSKNLKEFSLNEHFNLILYSTRQLQSHLILTTNCPSLIQIKPLPINPADSTGSVLKIAYDIVTSGDSFDLNAYANLLQEQNGQLYVQITCTLTHQVERIPIKFLFGMSDTSNFKPVIEAYSNLYAKDASTESWFSSFFGALLDFSPSQISTYLFLVIITLITILCFLKMRAPIQPTSAQQMTMNASAAAAAAIAANNMFHRSPNSIKENSSFNPYRYFTNSTDSDYMKSHDASPVGKQYLNTSLSPGLQRRSPQKQSPTSIFNKSGQNTSGLYDNQYTSPQRFNKLVRPELDRSNVRLFSVNTDVHSSSYLDQSCTRYDDCNQNQSGFQ